MKILCRVFGHRFKPVWPRTRNSLLLVCLRCHENRWQL